MIKMDMEKPKRCADCPMFEYGDFICPKRCRKEDRMIEDSETVPTWCPIEDDVPVKPVYKSAGIFCGACDSYIRTSDRYCANCSQKILWSFNRRTGEEQKEGSN